MVDHIFPPGSEPIRAVCLDKDGNKFIIDTRSHLERHVYVFGEYERPIRTLIKRLIPPGVAAVDVGANVGVHTVLMAQLAGPSGKVLALEPVPHLAARLRENVMMNQLADRVVIMPEAAGARDGMVDFFQPSATNVNQGQGSLAPLPYLAPHPVRIPMRRLDSILAGLGLKSIRFLKIDVEGFELHVLKGAQETLNSSPYILFEYSEMWGPAGSDWGECFDLLVQQQGYAVYQVGADRYQRPVLRAIPRNAPIDADTCTDTRDSPSRTTPEPRRMR